MATPDKNFRPSADRSVSIFGRIDDALVNALSPKIIKLREESNDPITVYINSIGGSTHSFEALWGLLNAKNLDQQTPRIITVAIGNAKSAAADMLTHGNYAYAHPHAAIMFHGSRTGANQPITAEDSLSIADSLRSTNEYLALRLANASVQRWVLQFALAKKRMTELKSEPEFAKASMIKRFAEVLKENVDSGRIRQIIDEAVTRCEFNNSLSKFVFDRANKKKVKRMASYDCEILKAILSYELSRIKNPDWELDENGIGKVVEDYLLLRDYHLGMHQGRLRPMCRRFGLSFLTADERKEYELSQNKPKDELEKWLLEKTRPRIQPFWYFIVSVWRQLQIEDNDLTPNDAYVLGAIDEVWGKNLPCYRLAAESTVGDQAKQEGDAGVSTENSPHVTGDKNY